MRWLEFISITHSSGKEFMTPHTQGTYFEAEVLLIILSLHRRAYFKCTGLRFEI